MEAQWENIRAIRFHKRDSFGGSFETFEDQTTGVEYCRRVLELNPDALLRIRDVNESSGSADSKLDVPTRSAPTGRSHLPRSVAAIDLNCPRFDESARILV